MDKDKKKVKPKKKKVNPLHKIRKILVLPNGDKDFHESWNDKHNYPNSDPADIPHPARIICVGQPNSGKSLFITNLIIKQDPPFEKIILLHPDESSVEWDHLRGKDGDDDGEEFMEQLTEIPSPEYFMNNKKKSCVILDDISYENLDKSQNASLGRILGYISTHCNYTVYLTSQTFHVIKPAVRRCANVVVLFRNTDLQSLSVIAKKIGCDPKKLIPLFKQYVTGPHDSLCFDLTRNSPYPIRKNLYEVLPYKLSDL